MKFTISDIFKTMNVNWEPLILLLIIIVLLLVVYIWGKQRFRNDYNKDTKQVKPFNSGNLEEINYNIQSSNMYWGFKKALEGFYNFMYSLHDGDLNNYLKFLIITMALCLLLISGGIL